MTLWSKGLLLALVCAIGCGDDGRITRDGVPFDGGRDGGFDGGPPDFGTPTDSGPLPDRSFLPPDAACATAVEEAEVERLPVDIIWVVDNSVSMEPAITQVNAGLNDFAALIAASGLDYRVIMLALRGSGEISVGGRSRYGVCIPPPLAGNSSCGDGTRFFQVEVDIHSTQPIEQILGTLGQTSGYTEGMQHGSAPWRDLLRPEATKTFVVVTDDNSRTCDTGPGSCAGGDPPLTVTSLEDFPGGPNPFNSRQLGPGILTAEYGDLFDGYLFSGIYGWGSEANPDVLCMYPGGDEPPSSGPTYTALVDRTGGVRAQICSGASAWAPFFDSVATAVTGTSRIECTLAFPPPPDGMALDVDRVNVTIRGESGETTLPRVDGAGACGAGDGWHYDDPVSPSEVTLCPASCDFAREQITDTSHGISVLFGCETILI